MPSPPNVFLANQKGRMAAPFCWNFDRRYTVTGCFTCTGTMVIQPKRSSVTPFTML